MEDIELEIVFQELGWHEIEEAIPLLSDDTSHNLESP